MDEFEKLFTALLSTPAGFVKMGNDLPTPLTSDPNNGDPRQSLHEELFDKFCSESGGHLRLKSPMGEGAGEKLFSDLLDDLDNISHNHTDSARRRRKAREIFSDWIFSGEGGRNSPGIQHTDKTTTSPSQAQQPRRRKSHGDQPTPVRPDLYSKWRPRSFEYLSEVGFSYFNYLLCSSVPPTDCKFTCHHRCRPAVTLDCPRGPVEEDSDGTSSISGEKVSSYRGEVETSLVEETGSGRPRVRLRGDLV